MARYLDGLSARSTTVHLAYGPVGIDFQPDGRDPVHWPWTSVRWADRQTGRLGSALSPDARLELDPDEQDRLLALVPALSVAAERGAQRRLVAMLAVAGACLFSLVFFGIPAASGPLARMTPHDLEIHLGNSVEAQLDLALQLCPDTTGPGARILQALADRIGSHADLPAPLTVRVIRMEMVNAFALPGGRVWVTRGLIDEAGSADELAAVIAHEIAHVERRDVLAGLYRAMGFGLVLDAVLGGGSGAGQQVIALGSNLTEMRNSRAVEQRADRRGIELLQAAGLDSRGMASFFARLQALEGDPRGSRWTEFLASHPDTGRRVAAARALASPGAPALSSADWTQVRALCPPDDAPRRPPPPQSARASP